MLSALKEAPGSPEEVAEKTGMSLFRVRSGLRELSYAGLVEVKGERYELTEKGAESLQDAQ